MLDTRSMTLSEEIDWKKFNRWIRPALESRGYHGIGDLRPVIRHGEAEVRVYIRYGFVRYNVSGDMKEAWVSISRQVLSDAGILKDAEALQESL